ncbi:hypothetical protein FHN55_15670 [Streptomyces sp. NP160]|uniref:hypothetical protein n=1 Tax=Streptomyces sp. NP160 TaxID=2586637 RepID=UPI0011199A4F|nr:hypothetical protein [Streptomyces sp. NP160]TNM63265.1 hypothetical protein FHN55_15670 [Streptomyces sp. NP160]
MQPRGVLEPISPPDGAGADAEGEALDGLADADHLQRRPDPGDRREVRLAPTRRTLERAEGVARGVQARGAEVTAQLTDGELHHLAVGTAAVRRVLERRTPDPDHPPSTDHTGGTP